MFLRVFFVSLSKAEAVYAESVELNRFGKAETEVGVRMEK